MSGLLSRAASRSQASRDRFARRPVPSLRGSRHQTVDVIIEAWSKFELRKGFAMTLPDDRRLAVGDRVLYAAVEKAGTITVLWPNGAAYVRCDDDELVACGIEVLAPEAR
jgi:hypothetical protein